MSERIDMTPDPLGERLCRFTPEARGLDAAAIVFAAGRASVRGRRFWPGLAGLLAVSQVVTAIALLRSPDRDPIPLAPAGRTLHENVAPVVSPEPRREIVDWMPRSELEPQRLTLSEHQIVQPDPPMDVLAARAGLRSASAIPFIRID